MVQITLNSGKTYDLATNLKVIYSLKDISGAKSLQDALHSISKLDMDKQLDFLYAAHQASKVNVVSKEEFVEDILDTYGVYALSNLMEKLSEGLLYSGLTPEEANAKKALTEELIAKQNAAGTNSSESEAE